MIDNTGQIPRVELAHFQALYNYDNDVTHEGLKLHPKLQVKDVYPDNFWVQRVSGATRLFSQTSAKGLKKMEELGLITGTTATQKMAIFFNEVFDLFNTSSSDKCPSRQPIKLDEQQRLARLEEIRQHLLCWKSTVPQQSRLSNITINHWNVSLQSLISSIKFLFEEGWSFVQTKRFNQDNLEVNWSSSFVHEFISFSLILLLLREPFLNNIF